MLLCIKPRFNNEAFNFYTMHKYFQIGKIVATFGVKGEVVLRHELGKKTSLKGLKVIFFEMQPQRFLPYFPESTRIKQDNEVLLKLEGIDSREQAQPLLQKSVWLTEADFQHYTAKKAVIAILGYQMMAGEQPLGEILEVIEQPMQVLCRLEIASKEVFIPLNEATLLQINHRKKQVHVNLPEGLLEVYMG